MPVSKSEQRPGFYSYHDSFDNTIGSKATLRLLVKHKSGLPLFHEAGIYFQSQGAVYVSSNRIATSDEYQQRIVITRIPVELLPNGDTDYSSTKPCVLRSLQETNSLAHEALERSLITWTDLPDGLTMPNGATKWTTEDGLESVLWCEQGRHDVNHRGIEETKSALVAFSEDGQTTTLLDSYQGKQFSSINDVVIHQQSGTVFFTDPDYGVGQSFKKPLSLKCSYAPTGLYAWSPSTGQIQLLDDRYDKPNGVTFVPDPLDPVSGNGLLVTTDTGCCTFEPNQTMGDLILDDSRPACIYTYQVTASECGDFPDVDVNDRVLLGHSACPIPDGIHPDDLGNVWVGNGDGVHIWNPWTGKLLGKILLPEGKGVANFCWAGPVIHSPQYGHARDNSSEPMYRLLLFSEDELWEACVAVNGRD